MRIECCFVVLIQIVFLRLRMRISWILAGFVCLYPLLSMALNICQLTYGIRETLLYTQAEQSSLPSNLSRK